MAVSVYNPHGEYKAVNTSSPKIINVMDTDGNITPICIKIVLFDI